MHREFEQMIVKSQGRIRYIASRYCHEGEFDDMYQEILLQLWRSFDSFQGQASRETWVYKVALNTACTFVKKAVKHKDLKQSISKDTISVTEPAQNNCQAEILNTFMNQLNDTDASILMMYLDGLSSDECAEVIGISANAVRSRIKRIKVEFENQYIGD
ncbi:RNA polymerase sigma factor [Litorilituus lipolyticus]|uniref:Sigma-70 family RNA polymerase sigma factor n=1 Tax=Litorilituus lipolyticus TaxID=2491017 RepID=A0A502KYD2_9GAMM|nr:sigma-70 family RNA polymerase sigma factor [Litorilituus lipolyticus]TPH15175.1 sigma-70 family RNA polymerase sigma factor [Litorilituus lipolyticus]